MIAQRSPSVSPALMLCIALLFALAVYAVFIAINPAEPTEHGVIKHGAAALTVRECLNKNGALQIWIREVDKRRAYICEIKPGRFGVQIVAQDTAGKWWEVSVFAKEKMTRLAQVMKYLTNSGYTPLP